jgi:hypothetical protein
METEPIVRHVNRRIPNFRSFTLALALPDIDSFIRAAQYFVAGNRSFLMAAVGIAKVHPGDRFLRKEGREVALKNLKSQNLKVTYVETDSRRIEVCLEITSDIVVRIGYKRGEPELFIDELYSRHNDRVEFDAAVSF